MGWYCEEGSFEGSGHALSRLMADVSSGDCQVDAVLVSDLLGLGRDAGELDELRKVLRKHRVELVLSSEHPDDCEPECEWPDSEEDDEAAG